MTEQELNSLALDLCISSRYRFIECLYALAIKHKDSLDPDVAMNIYKSFYEFFDKMQEAGLEVHMDVSV